MRLKELHPDPNTKLPSGKERKVTLPKAVELPSSKSTGITLSKAVELPSSEARGITMPKAAEVNPKNHPKKKSKKSVKLTGVESKRMPATSQLPGAQWIWDSRKKVMQEGLKAATQPSRDEDLEAKNARKEKEEAARAAAVATGETPEPEAIPSPLETTPKKKKGSK